MAPTLTSMCVACKFVVGVAQRTPTVVRGTVTGPIPSHISRLSRLKYLGLSCNQITGEWTQHLAAGQKWSSCARGCLALRWCL